MLNRVLIIGLFLTTLALVSLVVLRNEHTIEKSLSDDNLFFVIRVVDGDTIELDSGEIVRYLDVDTPETVHPSKPVECFGPEATRRNIELVQDRYVRLDIPEERTDKYGRLLAYVYTDEGFVNGALVWGGYAYARSYGQPGSLYPTLVQLEDGARIKQKGLWADCK
jgi:micrococcal nuclease